MLKPFEWLDVIDPSRAELETLGKKFGLPAALVQDCLEPEHLPKHEAAEGLEFLILRAYDEKSAPEADTVRELTRKVAVFYNARFMLTVHRKAQPYLEDLRAKWAGESAAGTAPRLLAALVAGVFDSYEAPLESALDRLETLAMEVFAVASAPAFRIEEGYYLKRRAAVCRRMLRSTLDLLPRIGGELETDPSSIQDLRETGERLAFTAEELRESVNTLLNLHISLSSQKTNEASHRINEVLRVLTIFSVFLLPLNLVTGIYGMNFEHMPELKWVHGYPMALTLMAVITVSIYVGFRRKGWLKA
jgi:magnesium transporter